MGKSWIGMAAIGLAACTAEEQEAFVEDPGAFACRERAVAVTDTTFAQTGSQPINRDFRGIGNYNIFAGDRTYRCVVDETNDVLSFEPI